MNSHHYSRLFLLIGVVKFCLSNGLSISKWEPFNEVDDTSPSDFIDIHAFGENAFIDPDDEITGKLVAQYNRTSNQNPEELGAYFEGDIRMPFHMYSRNGLVTQPTLWPKGVVPYEIAGTFDSNGLAAIKLAFDEYHKRTCIRFKLRSREKDYISIVNGRSGCWSSVGRIGGKQEVNLQSPQCLMKRGTPLHELMHVLGFIHEQNRYERDSYIIVRPENIKENMKVNFIKSSQQSAQGLMGIGYDYTSVMHYSATSFSKNGKPTIEPRRITRESRFMGQRSGFSRADVAKINVMYNCKSINVLDDS
ncbi:zinc metalloproteinase nas-1-like [Episyrphus balteatus]|uniref:zinc metalloproteinase nas-1-like n=1 Tax=Episyrphus balteatus TaxID=286459 RepID=UPI002486850E|nr:zinc metalloproteinase nas-1-like [Episyrphus balteatus]